LLGPKSVLLAKVVNIITIRVNSTDERVEGNKGKYAGGGVTSLMVNRVVDKWDLFPWLWYSKQE